MKKTRRVEVIRYRSWTTEIQGQPAAPATPDEQHAGDLMLDLLGSIPPMTEQVNCERSGYNDVPDHPPRHRAIIRLGKLLRLRK